MTTNEKYAAAHRAARALHGWTQAELAERMGVTAETVSKRESGARYPSKALAELAEATGLKLGDMDILVDLYMNGARRIIRREILEMAEGR